MYIKKRQKVLQLLPFQKFFIFLFEYTLKSKAQNGYLYAAGGTNSSYNHLKTQTNLSAAGKWSIKIESTGAATIVTTDTTVVKNTMRFNSTSSLFSCYNSGQKDDLLPVYLRKSQAERAKEGN